MILFRAASAVVSGITAGQPRITLIRPRGRSSSRATTPASRPGRRAGKLGADIRRWSVGSSANRRRMRSRVRSDASASWSNWAG